MHPHGDTRRRAHTLRRLLEQRRRVIQQELHQASALLRAEPSAEVADEAEQASRSLYLSIESLRIDQLTRTLRQIEAALLRHADGRYGICMGCGHAIPLQRLRSLPMARYCRTCQNRVEQRTAPLAA